MFPVNGSLRTALLFPRSGPGESGSPTSQVLLKCYDFPPRLSGRLFGSLPGSMRSSALRVSQMRSRKDGGAFRAGVIVRPATRNAGLHAHGRVRDLPGSQAIHPVPLPRSATPAEPTIPRLLDGFVDAAPALPTAKASADHAALAPAAYASRMVLPPSMQSSLPAGWLTFTGRVLNPLDRYKRFQIIHPPFLDFAWRKGSFTALLSEIPATKRLIPP